MMMRLIDATVMLDKHCGNCSSGSVRKCKLRNHGTCKFYNEVDSQPTVILANPIRPTKDWKCPRCGEDVIIKDFNGFRGWECDFCTCCGQAILWGEEWEPTWEEFEQKGNIKNETW